MKDRYIDLYFNYSSIAQLLNSTMERPPAARNRIVLMQTVLDFHVKIQVFTNHIDRYCTLELHRSSGNNICFAPWKTPKTDSILESRNLVLFNNSLEIITY